MSKIVWINWKNWIVFKTKTKNLYPKKNLNKVKMLKKWFVNLIMELRDMVQIGLRSNQELQPQVHQIEKSISMMLIIISLLGNVLNILIFSIMILLKISNGLLQKNAHLHHVQQINQLRFVILELEIENKPKLVSKMLILLMLML